MAKRPNILLITSDQQHWRTLGVNNPKIRTPNLDRLCREGVRFDRAYCPNPTCTPTRASIITGMYPSQHGAWSLGTKLFENVPVVGDDLQRAGYATSLIGKAHFQQLLNRHGMESLESQPLMRDLDFWRHFQGPWYGFQHVQIARNHAAEAHAGQHYGVWMEEKGLKNWRDYFARWPSDRAEQDRLYAQHHWQLPEEFHYNKFTSEKSIQTIDRAADAGQPFFLWSSFLDPHPPYMVPEPWASMYDPADMEPGTLLPGEHDRNPPHFGLTQEPSPDEAFRNRYFEDFYIHGFQSHLHTPERMRQWMAIYYGMISFMDHEIGRILGRLDELGLADDTLVVFSTDHGHFMGQHGLMAKGPFHYEDMLKIPFIVRWPSRVPAGQVSGSIQNLVDLAPTFMAAAGLQVPGRMTGLDQLPNWCGGRPVRNWSITENRHTFKNVHLRTYVNQRYKITVYRQGDDGEMFDLQEDPGEVRNLWHEPSGAGLKSQLLQEFMQATMSCEPTPMPRITGA